MLNSAGLQIMAEKRKMRAEISKIRQTAMKIRQVKLDAAMNRLIKSFFETNSNIPITQNVDFLQQFFRKAVLEVDQANKEVTEAVNESKR
jgi:hypothetical protein